MPRRKDYIHKRTDGRWEGRYHKGWNADGRILYGSVYGKSYQEVKEKRLLKIKEIEEETVVYDKCLLESVMNKWLTQMSIRVKKSTLFKYQTIIETQIKPVLGKRNNSELTYDELNQFVYQKIQSGKLSEKGGLSPSYVKTITIILNSVLKYTMQENLMPHKTFTISKPIVSKKELEILSQNEQKMLEIYLQNNMNKSNLSIFLSLYAGLRIGEVCALQWKDIDLNHQIIKARISIIRIRSEDGSYLIMDDPKTSSSIREIPIISSLFSLLKKYHNEDEIFVLSGTDDFIKPRTVEYRFKQILKKCNINSLNYHALRHIFAINCIQAGVAVK